MTEQEEQRRHAAHPVGPTDQPDDTEGHSTPMNPGAAYEMAKGPLQGHRASGPRTSATEGSPAPRASEAPTGTCLVTMGASLAGYLRDRRQDSLDLEWRQARVLRQDPGPGRHVRRGERVAGSDRGAAVLPADGHVNSPGSPLDGRVGL